MNKSILIYANCQGEELQHTAAYLPSFAGWLNFKWIPLHLISADDWMTRYGPAFMADVVAVWEQVETGPSSEHRQELHRRLPADCQVIRFPPFSMLCLWPFAGNDPRLAVDPLRYPWSDSIAASLANESLADDALFERYMELSATRMPDLQHRLRLDIARWQSADALADIKVASWVEQLFRKVRLFHTSGHVTALPTAYLLPQLLQRTAIVPRDASVRLRGEIDTLLRHHQGQDFESVPIHPLVAQQLDLKFYRPDERCRWHAHEWTFREYILHYIRWAPYLG